MSPALHGLAWIEIKAQWYFLENYKMSLLNITPGHFATTDGRPALTVDAEGFPHISAEMVSDDDRRLASIALAIYENCSPLHASRANVETVTEWVRQFKARR
jgi:hypothetical protein